MDQKKTGIVCPTCREPVAVVDHIATDGEIMMRCPACGNRWTTALGRNRHTVAATH